MTTAHLAVKPLLIITLYMRPHSSPSVTGRVRASQSLAAFEPYSHLAAFEPYFHWPHASLTFVGHIYWPHTLGIH